MSETADLIVACTATNPGKRVPVSLPAFAAMVAEHLPDNVVPLPVTQVQPLPPDPVPVHPETAPLPVVDHQSDIDQLFAGIERLTQEAASARAWAAQMEQAIGQIWDRLQSMHNDEVQQRLQALEQRLIEIADEQQRAAAPDAEEEAVPLPAFLRGAQAPAATPPPLPQAKPAVVDTGRILAAVTQALDARTAAIEQMVGEAEERLMAMLPDTEPTPAAVALRTAAKRLVASDPDLRVWTIALYARDGQEYACDLMAEIAPALGAADHEAAAEQILAAGDAANVRLVRAYEIERRTLAAIAAAGNEHEAATILAAGIEAIDKLGTGA